VPADHQVLTTGIPTQSLIHLNAGIQHRGREVGAEASGVAKGVGVPQEVEALLLQEAGVLRATSETGDLVRTHYKRHPPLDCQSSYCE